ncbi:MAG: acetyl-CoA carboxylase biotin carboxyl carrier protein [Thermomicrobiales bacterium]
MDATNGPVNRVSDNTTVNGSTSEVMDAVRELISLMGRGGISELDLSTPAMTVRLRGATSVAIAPVAVGEQVTSLPLAIEEPVGHTVTSPMIGTYYSAPAPGEAPFVQIGDEVEVGQAIGIIEAMKIMNEIISDRAGIVSEILVSNAQSVEYGSPLIRLVDQPGA